MPASFNTATTIIIAIKSGLKIASLNLFLIHNPAPYAARLKTTPKNTELFKKSCIITKFSISAGIMPDINCIWKLFLMF